jgi:transcription antitermination factor NusG
MILNAMETAIELNTLESPANGTDDREARSFRWYAARTQMNCERKAEKEFRNIAKETYLPIQEEIHQWSDRKKKVQRLVIPMIIFVKMHCDDVKNINHAAHVYGFIGSDRHNTQPASIPDKDIETLRYMLGQSTSPVSIEPLPIILGDKVLINRGNLKGLEGYVMAYSKGSAYICIKLDLLGCAKVSISLSDITKI